MIAGGRAVLSMKGEVQLEPAGAEGSHSDSDPLLQNHVDSLTTPPPVISTEINSEEDIENGSVPSCRICLESDCEPGDPHPL